jgi:hypothetical protein
VTIAIITIIAGTAFLVILIRKKLSPDSKITLVRRSARNRLKK